MINKHTLFCAILLTSSSLMAQQPEGYQFTEIVKNPVTSVKDQAVSGTCWCFATTSFIEAELLRKGKGKFDLSEMFIVRQKYMNQLNDNFLRRGKGNIGEGSLTPSWFTAFNQTGIVPEEIYSGINYDSKFHNHSEMTGYLTAIANEAIKKGKRSEEYNKLIHSLFDIYLGKIPEKFTYKGKEYTPKSFAESLDIHSDDYVMLTSFTHKPYYQEFEVEVPDNWEHAQMYNLPLDEMINATNHALEHGYTVCWDGDVSEKGFSFRNGVAINPDVDNVDAYQNSDRARWGQLDKQERLNEVYSFKKPYPEQVVTPENRQAGYESFTTTDDHLMHITGMAKDQNGTKYYITKNSWAADSNKFGGYLNMSESYVRAKTIYVLMHKDALPKDIARKLNIR